MAAKERIGEEEDREGEGKGDGEKERWTGRGRGERGRRDVFWDNGFSRPSVTFFAHRSKEPRRLPRTRSSHPPG